MHSDLAERLAPHLPTLMHPGDDKTQPFPLALPTFQTATLPEGMQQEMAEELGLPTPDLGRHFLEAVFALVDTVGEAEIVDKTELADLRAAAASQESKRQQTIELNCLCGVVLGRISVLDFDSAHPRVNGSQLIKALSVRSPDCATKHKAVN